MTRRRGIAKAKIFMSYGRGDDDPNYNDPKLSFMRRLYNDLVKAGYDVWWDRESLPSRALAFLQEIRDAIAVSDRVILVVGSHALQSEYVRVEWKFALSQSIPVTPILRNGEYQSIPEALNNYNSPDFRDDAQYEQKLAELLRILAQPVIPLGNLIGVPPLPPAYIERDEFSTVRNLILADSEKPIIITPKHQTIIVYGIGGVGKSTLAAAIGRSGEVRRAFPDGIFWIEIGKKSDPLARLSDIGAYFGDVKEEYRDIPRAKQRLGTILRDKRVLIVLDDVWDYKHADAFRLVDTRCRIIITTRLTNIATQLSLQGYPLGMLSIAEGMALFQERLGSNIRDFSSEYREIIEILWGHTLAVSIAAGRLSEEGISYVTNLLRRLKEGKTFSTLKLHNDDKDLNLEKSLYWSYESLSPDMQRRFRLTGVFAIDGTFGEAAVQAVWQDKDADDTHDAIKTLVSAGMLERHERQRYSQHSLLRAYARALTSAAELYEAQANHFSFYETYYSEQLIDVQTEQLEIKADLENLREAFIWGFEAELKRACQLLLVKLDEYYRTHQLAMYRYLLEIALALSTDDDYSFRHIQDVNDMVYLDDEEDPFTTNAETQTIQTQGESSQLCRANILKTLGDLSLRENDFLTAHDFYLSALPIYKQNSSKTGQAHCLKALGDFHARQSDYLIATNYYQGALLLYEMTEDSLNQAHTLLELGELNVINSQFVTGRSLYIRALRLFKGKYGNLLGQANTLYALGKLSVEEGNIEDAYNFYLEAFKIYEHLHHRIGLVNIYGNMARMYRKMGNTEQAKIHYGYALALGDTMHTHLSKIQRWRKEYDLFISKLR